MTPLTAEEKLKLLINFANEIATEVRLEALLDKIAHKVTAMLNCDRCIIYLLDKKHHHLWSTISRGKGLEHSEIKIPLKAKHIISDAVKQKKTINIPRNKYDLSLTMNIDLVTEYKTKNLLLVPIKNEKGNIMGVFHVSNKIDGNDFDDDDTGILQLLGTMAANYLQMSKLYENLRLSQLETIYRLALAAEFRDQEDTPSHLQHISIISYLLAKELKLSETRVEDIKHASPLHDIGKVAIPDKILLKPGRLTNDEFETMKLHTKYGSKILEGANSRFLKTAQKICISHHEKYDGTGYPVGLAGDKIPIEAKIVSVADVFDALCMKRHYKPAWKPEDAFEYIKEKSGKDFDPKVVKAFEKIFPKIIKLYTNEDSSLLEELSFTSTMPVGN